MRPSYRLAGGVSGRTNEHHRGIEQDQTTATTQLVSVARRTLDDHGEMEYIVCHHRTRRRMANDSITRDIGQMRVVARVRSGEGGG